MHTSIGEWRRWMVMAWVVAGAVGADAGAGEAPVLQRRAALVRQAAGGPKAVPGLVRALDDPSALVRRTAARLLRRVGAPAERALVKALGNSDVLVRRTAVHGLGETLEGAALPYLATGLRDPHVLVRRAVVTELLSVRPRTEAVTKLLLLAAKDKDNDIRMIVLKALWPFHKENVSVRDDPTWDHDVRAKQTIRLPKDGWRFKLDPDRTGHQKKWFEPAFDDAAWKPIAIEQAWQKAGYDYIGVAWYRRWIDLPAKPKHLAVEIHFLGVDECAWVWLNGQYVGQHDIGPVGWDQPFLLDITQYVTWGGRNQITVRAMNTACAGGIWRPVQIEVLE